MPVRRKGKRHVDQICIFNGSEELSGSGNGEHAIASDYCRDSGSGWIFICVKDKIRRKLNKQEKAEQTDLEQDKK